MKLYVVNLLNGIILVAFGLWAYFEAGSVSKIALIAPAFGFLFMLCTPLLKKGHSIVSYILALLTLLVILTLFYPLITAIRSPVFHFLSIFRLTMMLAVSIISLVTFIQSFIAIRRANL